MIWLLAYITAHAIQISAIGATAYAVSQAESVVINTHTIIKEETK